MRSSRRLWLEACARAIRHASQVVWLSDGARGLWRLFDERFVDYARGILDFYHAVQQLWKGAAACWMAAPPRRAGGGAWPGTGCGMGQPDGVLADLADALDVEGFA